MLWAAGPIVLVIGVIVFFVSRNDSGSSAKQKPLPAAPAQPAVNQPDQKAFTKEAQKVARKFMSTAGTRKNTGASWELLDPTYPSKNEYTKQTWAKGEIPVVPLSWPQLLDHARFQVSQTYPGGITVEVAVFYKGKKPELFEIGLRQRGTSSKPRWLVDYWMTRYRAGRRPPPE